MPSKQVRDFGDQFAVLTLTYDDRYGASSCKGSYSGKKPLVPRGIDGDMTLVDNVLFGFRIDDLYFVRRRYDLDKKKSQLDERLTVQKPFKSFSVHVYRLFERPGPKVVSLW